MTSTDSSDQQLAPAGDAHMGAAEPLGALRAQLLAVARELSGVPAGTHADGEQGGGSRLESLLGSGGPVTLERPRRAEFGDYSTNAALVLGPALETKPRELAERLGEALRGRMSGSLERYEVAGPGFLNLFVSDSWLAGALAQVLAEGPRFGSGGPRPTEPVLVEFVSANPTGPMHVGHARNAAYGDALARMLAARGYTVEREFYVNDAGAQIRKFGESVAAAARGEPTPPDGYHGDYVEDLGKSIPGAGERDPAEVGRDAVVVMVRNIQAVLGAFHVESFDHWTYESELYEGHPNAVERTLASLADGGHTYTSEGALWLRTTDFGDDKDRVLVRSTGEHTYFASDIAYHQSRRELGYERQLNVWGADHHGYLLRMKAAYAALGGDPDELELLIMQLVHLVRGGERAQMSKRAGEFVTLEELVTEIGVDAARWYLLARSHDTTVDLDLDLAREQSAENPVYYVQYAHARIASIVAKAGAARVQEALAAAATPSGLPLHPAERSLIEQLLAFPGELEEASERRAPHRLAAYVLELAQGFTAFYRDCRVLGAEPYALESLRIALSEATRVTIARCLGLLGVSAPQEM
ncbi:MAG TPA: arginine--tRNA ligase [Solirubrobacteraceae bacterium]|nr:arginine--tRNA ligase [Solirubrobacteraceae bacterium]